MPFYKQIVAQWIISGLFGQSIRFHIMVRDTSLGNGILNTDYTEKLLKTRRSKMTNTMFTTFFVLFLVNIFTCQQD